MMMNDVVPPQSEIRRYMGSSMADLFFEYGHPDSRLLLGVIPLLEGPHQELWISPSDQLIQKVALVPPLTNKCIKACTHKGILAIGQKAMEKYERDLYDKMIKKYEEENGETRSMFEAEKRRAVQLAEEEIRLKYERQIETLREESEQELQTALAGAFEKCNKSMQKAVARERIEVTRLMLQKLRKEISYVIDSVHERFEENVRVQKENMIADFNEIIRRERAKTNDKIREMERKNDEALQIQRHELEMQNFADVTYVLCTERMRSSSEKHALHLCFEKQIQALKGLLVGSKEILNLMKTESVAKETDHKLWENKLLEVVREFQKFINFAFRAVPGQAEFLLSLESLLILETDNKLREQQIIPELQKSESLHTKVNTRFEVVEIIDASGEKWIPIQLIPDQPNFCCTKDQLVGQIVRSEIALCSNEDYLDKPDPTSSVVSLKSNGSLPFCYLENVLYVRSDYREKNDVETKTMSQLAEGSRFVMELKKENKPCNLEIVENVTGSKASNSFKFNAKHDSADGIYLHEAPPGVHEFQDPPSKLEGITAHSKMAENIKISDISGETFKLIGEDGIEDLQTPRDFTCARIRSLMRIFKLHPSLRQLMIPQPNLRVSYTL